MNEGTRSILRWPPGRGLVAAAVAALAVATGVVALVARDDEPSFRFGGDRVLNGAALLKDADRDFVRTAHREDAALVDGARCYFSQLRPGTDIQPDLRCGPVVHFGGSSQRPWDNVALRGLPAKNGVRLERTGAAKPGQALATGEILTRPDRARPAKVDNLAPPPPPRLSPGQVALASGTAPNATLRRLDAAVVGPGDLELRIEELGVVGQIRLSQGLRRPAHGEELVVASLNVRSGAGASMEIVAGARRAPLPDAARQGRHMVVASVPIGVESRLELTLRGITQGLSLRSGQRVGPGPALLSERPRAALDRVVERQQVSFGLSRAPQPVTLSRFTVAEVELLAHSEWLGTAPPGSGWLAVEVRDFGVPVVPDAVAVRLSLPTSFVAVLPDGRPVPAAELGMPPAGRTVYFPVPDTIRAGVVRITPTFEVEGATGSGRLAFPMTEIAFELRPSQAPEDRLRRH